MSDCLCCNDWGAFAAGGRFDVFFLAPRSQLSPDLVYDEQHTGRVSGAIAAMRAALVEMAKLPEGTARAYFWMPFNGVSAAPTEPQGVAPDDIPGVISRLDEYEPLINQYTLLAQYLDAVRLTLEALPGRAGRRTLIVYLQADPSFGTGAPFNATYEEALDLGHQQARQAADALRAAHPDWNLLSVCWPYDGMDDRNAAYVGGVAGDGYLRAESRAEYEASILTLVKTLPPADPNFGPGGPRNPIVTAVHRVALPAPPKWADVLPPTPALQYVRPREGAAVALFACERYPDEAGFEVLVDGAVALTLPPSAAVGAFSLPTRAAVIAGLTDGANHVVRVRALRDGGPPSPLSPPFLVTPGPGASGGPPDAPTEPIILRESAAQALFYFQHPRPIDVQGFEILRDGTPVLATTDLSAALSGMDVQPTDVWTVRAISHDGAVSAESAAAVFDPKLPEGVSIRLYSKDGTKRRRLPLKNVLSIRAKETRVGGYMECTLTLAGSRGEYDDIQPLDRIDWHYKGVRLYRGFFYDRVTRRDLPNKVTLTFYGASKEAGRPIGDRKLSLANADLASYFAQAGAIIVRDCDLPGLAITATPVGMESDSEEIKQQHVGDFVRALVDKSGGSAQWGGRVDSQGRNEIYFEPIGQAGAAADITLVTTARSVSLVELAENTSPVVNDLTIIGGQWKYPNLVPDGSLKETTYADETSENLVANSSFNTDYKRNALGQVTGKETKDWGFSGGADSKTGGNDEADPRTGDWMIVLPGNGAKVEQTRTVPGGLTGGDTFTAGAYLRLVRGSGNPSFANQVRIRLTFRKNGADIGIQETVVEVNSALWGDKAFINAQAPAGGADGYRLEFSVESGALGGTLIDDAFVYNASRGFSPYWRWNDNGGAATVALQLWDVAGGVARFGETCGYARVTKAEAGPGKDARLERRGGEKFTVKGNQSIRASGWFRSGPVRTAVLQPDGSTVEVEALSAFPSLAVQIEAWDDDGKQVHFSEQFYPAPGGVVTAHVLRDHVAILPPNAATAAIYFAVKSPGAIYFDGLQARDAVTDAFEFAEGNTATFRFTAEEVFAAAVADPTHPDHANANSRATFGRRAEIESYEGIRTSTDALQVATAYFRKFATREVRPVIELLHDATPLRTGMLVRTVGRDAPHMAATSLPLVEIETTLERGGLLRRELQLFSERPDPLRVVQAIIRRDAKAQGGGGNPSYQAGAASANGLSSAPAQVPVFLSNLSASPGDPTLHDAYRPDDGPHVTPTERATNNATAAEVADTHTSDTLGMSFPSAKERFENIEQQLGGGGLIQVYELTAGQNLALTGSASEILVICAGGNTVTLPPAAAQTGRVSIRAKGAGISVVARPGETIEGAASLPFTSVANVAQALLLHGYGGINTENTARRCATLVAVGTDEYVIASDIFAG